MNIFIRSLRLLNRADCYVWLSKEVVAVHVWNAPEQWHNWQVAGVRTTLLPKAWPLTSLYFGIYYSFGFSRLLIFAFIGVFSGDFEFLYSRSVPDLLLFLNYFLSVSRWAPSS